MSKEPPKLGTLKLTDAQKEAVAEMVETEGFKVWKKVIIPSRALQIAGLSLNGVPSEANQARAQGQYYENAKQVKILEDLAKGYNMDPDQEDDESEEES